MSESKSIFQLVTDVLNVFEKSETSHLRVEEIDSVLADLSKVHEFSISQKIYPDEKAVEYDILKEIAVNEIRLLCVPFLIGYFYHIRPSVRNNKQRILVVQESTKFLNLFLNICDSSSLFKNEPILHKYYKSYASGDKSFFTERTSLTERTKRKNIIKSKIDFILKDHKKSSSVSSSVSSSYSTITSSPSVSSSSLTTANSEEFIIGDLSHSDNSHIRELFVFQLIQFAYQTFKYLKSNEQERALLIMVVSAEENGIDLRKEEQKIGNIKPPFRSMMVLPGGKITPVDLKTLAAGNNAYSSECFPEMTSFSPVLSSSPSSTPHSSFSSRTTGTGVTVMSLKTLESSGLTRLELQKKMFSPTPPYTYTLEEEQEYEAKRCMDRLAVAKQHEEEEKQIPKPDPDKDDGAEVIRQREVEWDEFKDEHPTGSGNRKG